MFIKSIKKSLQALTLMFMMAVALTSCQPKSTPSDNKTTSETKNTEVKDNADSEKPKENTTSSQNHAGEHTSLDTLSEATKKHEVEPKISVHELEKILLAEYPDADFLSLSTDEDKKDSSFEYEVELLSGNNSYEITVDGMSGKIIKTEKEDASFANAFKGLSIGEQKQKAIQKIRSEKPDGHITKVKPFVDHNIPLFEVWSKNQKGITEYKLDAKTLDILETRERVFKH